ncbi:MAG TPA: toxin-antitoxin system YwqK family antitoxin [Pirellulales bacterium]|jgi:antitoxin component YwqK of YwqJK toxin-antitoxin module
MKFGTFRWKAVSLGGTTLIGCALLACLALAGCSKNDSAADKPADAGSAPAANISGANSADQTTPAADKGSNKQNLLEEKRVPAATLVDQINVDELYPNKKVHVHRQVKRYSDDTLVNHGLYSSFYLSGQKLDEGNYIDGIKDGQWKLWHENGQLAKTENYVGGKLEGQWSMFDPKGVKRNDVSYKAGKRDGKWITYGDDGKQIREQVEYRDGKLNGTNTQWDADGKKTVETHFENGQLQGLQESWFPNGQLSRHAEFKDGKPNGTLIRWNEKGEKLLEEKYADGKLVRTPSATGK